MNGAKGLARVDAKKLILGVILIGIVLMKINNVTLLEMLIMSITLFGGYETLIYFTFLLSHLNIINILGILFLMIGATFIVWGLLGSKLNAFSRFRNITYLKSILTFLERLTLLGKVLWFLMLVFTALLFPLFAINLSEVSGLVLGVYEYFAPSIFEGQKQHMLASFIIFIFGVAFESYIILKIMSIWRKWRLGQSSPLGKSQP